MYPIQSPAQALDVLASTIRRQNQRFTELIAELEAARADVRRTEETIRAIETDLRRVPPMAA